MSIKELLAVIFVAVFFVSCQTAAVKENVKEGQIPRRQMEAIKSAAKAYTGHDVNDDDIYRLANQLQNQNMQQVAETQSAIESVANALTVKPMIHYCPVDGQRFSSSIRFCPQHNIELKLLE